MYFCHVFKLSIMKLNNIYTLLIINAMLVLPLAAQDNGITPDMLSTIQKSYAKTASNKALQNAIVNNDINKLAMSYENAGAFDSYFSNKVNSQAISDQKSSGRCWLFTGMNVLRSKTITQHDLPADFQFSQVHIFFWDQLEKANLFLQAVIDTKNLPFDDKKVEWLFKNPIGDGGQFTGVANLIDKYGLVPMDVMKETNSSNNTRIMSNLLSLRLREDGLRLRELSTKKGTTEASLQSTKLEMLKSIYQILALNLGEPPTKFNWTQRDKNGKPIETKEYTPLSFREKFANEDFSHYYMIMNDPTRDYYQVYEIEYDRHMYDGNNWKYLNLPMEEIAEMAIASIKDSTMMYFSCDVGKFLDREKGFLDVHNYDYTSLLGVDFTMDKKERVMTFASGSSHAMTLCAVDLNDKGKPNKWMVENSWGASYGYKGFLIMTNDWFNEYMFRLVIEDKYISAKNLKLFENKPIILPPWDPMFAPEDESIFNY